MLVLGFNPNSEAEIGGRTKFSDPLIGVRVPVAGYEGASSNARGGHDSQFRSLSRSVVLVRSTLNGRAAN